MQRLFNWVRSVHDRYARVILAGIAALLLPLMVMTTVATADNWRQDKERDHLLECFDQYADAQSTGSTVIRAATVAVDQATVVRDHALNAEGIAFKRVTHGIRKHTVTAEDFNALDEALTVRARAGRALDRAQAELDRARRDNPVPAPPSKFCAD